MFTAKKNPATARATAALNDMLDELVGRVTSMLLSNETEIADRSGLPPPPSSTNAHGRDIGH